MQVKGNTKVKMIYVVPKESYKNFKAGIFKDIELARKHLVEYKMQYDLPADPPQRFPSSASDRVNTEEEEAVGQKRPRGRQEKSTSTNSQGLHNLEDEEGAGTALAKKLKTANSSKQESRSAKATRGKGKSK
jgi:hypothetical protein